MREILFKAKRKDNGEWVEGFCFKYKDKIYITEMKQTFVLAYYTEESVVDFNMRAYEIEDCTLCQWTGLTDKNDNKIWENDICKYYNPIDRDGIGVIKNDYVNWISGTIAKNEILTPLFYLKCGEEWEVIGNIFDNEELIL